VALKASSAKKFNSAPAPRRPLLGGAALTTRRDRWYLWCMSMLSRPTVALLGLTLLLAACNDDKPKATLMVTWLVPGQPPQSTQTPMKDIQVCETAKQEAIASGEAARQERIRVNDQDRAEANASIKADSDQARAQGAIVTGLSPEEERKLRGEPLPQVSAYCISN
jgi:hypothetical protein